MVDWPSVSYGSVIRTQDSKIESVCNNGFRQWLCCEAAPIASQKDECHNKGTQHVPDNEHTTACGICMQGERHVAEMRQRVGNGNNDH